MSPAERARAAIDDWANHRQWELPEVIAAAIRAAVAEEREACAKVADEQGRYRDAWGAAASVVADNIRFRGKEPP